MTFHGCSLTKKVAEGEYLLTKNKFEFEGKEKPFKSEIPDYVKQKPNGSGFFGAFPFKLMLYNSVPAKFDEAFTEYYDLSKKKRNQHSLDSLLSVNDLEKHKGRSLWLKRFIFNQGEPPVILDSSATDFSADNLERYYFDRGYFDAKVEYSHTLDSVRKKGKVNYKINPGEESIIESYNFAISDTAIARHIETLTKRNSKIKVGERYDLNNFIKERDQIADFLKNRGYYKFNDDGQAIEFTADTTNTDKHLNVTLWIPIEKKDTTKLNKIFTPYRFGEIHLYPDSNYNPEAFPQPEYFDTIYEGYHLHYLNPNINYKPKFFTDAIVVREGALYRLNSENQTKRNISKREGITLTRIHSFEEKGTENDSILNLHISFSPKKKYDLFYGTELSWSEFMNFGVSPQVSLLVRNLFKGGENLESTLRGTLGNVNKKFTAEKSFFNAFEWSFQNKMTFPYLLFPINTDGILSKRYYKQTDIRMGTSVQRNIGLGRVTYSTGLDYNISFRDTHSHTLSILNTEFVNNLQVDNYFNVFEGDRLIRNSFFNYYFNYNPQAGNQYEDGELNDAEMTNMILTDNSFLNSLDNQGLEDLSIFLNMNFRKQTITQNILILSFVYQYTLNQSERNNRKNPWYFRGRIELAGNMLNLLDKAFQFEKMETTSGKESRMIFNVPYSQFVKIDLDVRKYFKTGIHSSLATRLYLGLVQPYGNTDFIPFARSYTAGGANDVRAWAAATLGPAGLPRYAGGDDVFAIERMKLLFSVEYRFNVFELINSALFIDAGNIWGTDKKEELTLFKFGQFYKELGVGAGFGIRLDLTYFLLRFDFAYKIHDPSYPEGSRWRFNDFNILKPRLAFGINYPF
jgi:hypothetical protein